MHESIFGSAIIFSVVADAIDVIGIVVQRPVRVVFEMIVIAGLGQLFRRCRWAGLLEVALGGSRVRI